MLNGRMTDGRNSVWRNGGKSSVITKVLQNGGKKSVTKWREASTPSAVRWYQAEHDELSSVLNDHVSCVHRSESGGHHCQSNDIE